MTSVSNLRVTRYQLRIAAVYTQLLPTTYDLLPTTYYLRSSYAPPRPLPGFSGGPGSAGRPGVSGGPPGRFGCGEPPGAGTAAGGAASVPPRPRPAPGLVSGGPPPRLPSAAAACAGRLASASGPFLIASRTWSSALCDGRPR